jgi:hypothetical protein
MYKIYKYKIYVYIYEYIHLDISIIDCMYIETKDTDFFFKMFHEKYAYFYGLDEFIYVYIYMYIRYIHIYT